MTNYITLTIRVRISICIINICISIGMVLPFVFVFVLLFVLLLLELGLLFFYFQVYIDGIVKAHSPGFGILDTDWGYKACIGSFDFDGRYLNGEVDDFQVFNYAITDRFQIENLIRSKCERKPKERQLVLHDQIAQNNL